MVLSIDTIVSAPGAGAHSGLLIQATNGVDLAAHPGWCLGVVRGSLAIGAHCEDR